MKKVNTEVEVRFLNIVKEDIIKKLNALNAKDLKEDFIQEVIFYDKELTWSGENKFIRVRKTNTGITMTYKHQHTNSVDGTTEIELEIDNYENAKLLLVEGGLVAFREQEKKRHSFIINDTKIDIDTWPSVPTYVEIEGSSESELKEVAKSLSLKWEDAVFENAKIVIEDKYKIPVSKLRYFTFSKME